MYLEVFENYVNLRILLTQSADYTYSICVLQHLLILLHLEFLENKYNVAGEFIIFHCHINIPHQYQTVVLGKMVFLKFKLVRMKEYN